MCIRDRYQRRVHGNFSANDVEEVILGCVLAYGLGQHPVRQAWLNSGYTNSVPCTSVNRICGSGMMSTIFGAQMIMTGYRNVVMTGGFESMSRAVHTVLARGGLKNTTPLVDSLFVDGLTDAKSGQLMGLCTEGVAERMGVTKEDQDAIAIASYENAIKAKKEGFLDKEIVEVPIKKGVLKEDEELLKFDKEKMKKLKPAFKKDGTITAGNASKISDGAQGILLMAEEVAKERGIKPLARIVGFEEYAHEPEDFTVAAVEASKKLLKKCNMTIKDMDAFEFNEAFSIVPILGQKSMQVDLSKCNVHGSAAALGHPLGMSGARIIGSLINVLEHKQGKLGLAAICNGGGGGTAMILEKIQFRTFITFLGFWGFGVLVTKKKKKKKSTLR
eukprot:TRINITY_DN769_c0_g1_i3.p1 TRINITY_DN769_c0_g1~~TRINITY_DN769_c0_g1_i3.p1  ORF type:complete len:388 (+),score=88.87 TRINITY_DN769_c0_g1_i3:164-1327(+)